jgi:hypothetical protein
VKNYLFAIAVGATVLVATNASAQVLSPTAAGGTGGTAGPLTQKTSGDFVAAALGQAPTSLTGQCAAEVKLFFGVLQYGHTLHAECLYQASANFTNAGYVFTGAMLLEKAYNGGDQVYDESFRGALRSDVDRIALSQAAQIISPSPDEISKLTQQISAIADRTRIIEERLSAIRTR